MKSGQHGHYKGHHGPHHSSGQLTSDVKVQTWSVPPLLAQKGYADLIWANTSLVVSKVLPMLTSLSGQPGPGLTKLLDMWHEE